MDRKEEYNMDNIEHECDSVGMNGRVHGMSGLVK